MAETIRAFIAVELNDQIKETIRGFQEHLKPLDCDISWVKPENVHLTLKFLGDVKTKMIPSAMETLGDVCKDLRPFDTTLTQPGVFPDLHHPRVVWVGLDDVNGNLARLAESLETALGNIGFKKERRDFQSHITVGRFRSTRNLFSFTEKFAQHSISATPPLTISSIALFKSTLVASCPIYEPLQKFFF